MAEETRSQLTEDKQQQAPEPDDPQKLDSPTEISKRSWGYIFKRAFNEFLRDGCTDLAAALTYFAVLSMFPGLLAVVSMLGVVGQGEATTTVILDLLRQNAPASLVELVSGPISQLATQRGAGLFLVTGILGSLWTASGYVGAFGRAMNKVYEIDEGRPIWKLRPIMLLVTLVMALIVVVMMLVLTVSGDVARAVGDALGLGETALLVWGIAKWPLLVLLAVLLLAVLYYYTPNVRQPKFRWISVGAVVALLGMALAGVAFAFYVANFSKYNATYGLIGSVIVLLLGLWILNNMMLLGAEVDAEIERGRELQSGIVAEESVQLPPRDTKLSEKNEEKREKLVAEGREIRLEHGPADSGQVPGGGPAEDDDPDPRKERIPPGGSTRSEG